MRRLVLEDPLARSAVWSRNLALFAFVVAVIGIVLARRGLAAEAALSIEVGALSLAALAILLALVAMVVIWRTGYRGLGLALGGLVLACLLFVYPAYLTVEARTVPMVADVSTSLQDPPRFLETITALAARNGYVPPKAMGEADIALQRRLYPDLQTLDLDADASDVVRIVTRLLKRRRWTIVDEKAPKNFATGHIDAVVKSAVMGFPADVTVRIRGIGARTQVDIRSTSRASWQERPGANAARVSDLAADIENAVGES